MVYTSGMSLGTVILGVLADGPAHGYYLKREHDDRFPSARPLAYGQVYATLGRLERDIVGMAQYRVLLRAKLVEQPKLAFLRRAVEGGRDRLHVGDQTIRITDQPGLQGNPRRWRPSAGCPQ